MLTETVKIYIPSTLAVSRKAPRETVRRTVKTAARLFASLFGGFTIVKAQGGYVATDNSLVVERITIVQASASRSAMEQALGSVLAFARGVCEHLEQECVAVEVNGRMQFVSAAAEAAAA